MMASPSVREALFYERSGDAVRCAVCERRCLISEGKKGVCGTRMNVGGRLFTLVYGDLNALESRPIEIKPFFHFWPGSSALTFSTWSCNFKCPWCQNWSLSKTPPDPSRANFVSAERVVELARRRGDHGLCVSFTEPTLLFEFSLDCFKLARRYNLYNTFVSNGYMTVEALERLRAAGLDAINIDMKGDAEVYERYCGGVDVEKVWRNARAAKKMGMHVEMVNLVITGVNDDEDCLRWVIERHLKELGEMTPLHFTRYHPAYKFNNPATKVETLERACELAKRLGVAYVYIGNVPGHKYESTYCHECGRLLIRRYSYSVLRYELTAEKRCPGCGAEIPIVGHYVRRASRIFS
ncbi:MAG: Pyruvate-formate lyase-activating enzyme [Candidatus Alkanophagales archaeon MCA70_species_1]|nr:Pyruvate-formate lyase-activating enzyme [Candidatus Alkanophaga volatiphilum]